MMSSAADMTLQEAEQDHLVKIIGSCYDIRLQRPTTKVDRQKDVHGGPTFGPRLCAAPQTVATRMNLAARPRIAA